MIPTNGAATVTMLEKLGRIKVKLCEDGGGYGDGDDHCLAGASASDVDWQERIATDVGP